MSTIAKRDRDDAERVAQFLAEVLGYDPVSVKPVLSRGWVVVGRGVDKTDHNVQVAICRDGAVRGSRSVIDRLRSAEVI